MPALHRLTHSKPLVELFFEWVDRQLERQGFTPTNPFIQALNYVRERRVGLELFLTDPDVPIDTNHLERALRVVPMGRKSWLFCWTELGAKHVGIIQSLIVTASSMAAMLGARREGITEAAHKLQTASLISYCRGRIRVIDGPGLGRRSCECYRFIARQYAALNLALKLP